MFKEIRAKTIKYSELKMGQSFKFPFRATIYRKICGLEYKKQSEKSKSFFIKPPKQFTINVIPITPTHPRQPKH